MMMVGQDYFRVLLLFHEELEQIEVLPFAATSSNFTFDGSAGGMIRGEQDLLKYMNETGLDSFVRIEDDGHKRVRVLYPFSAENILQRLKDRFVGKMQA